MQSLGTSHRIKSSKFTLLSLATAAELAAGLLFASTGALMTAEQAAIAEGDSSRIALYRRLRVDARDLAEHARALAMRCPCDACRQGGAA